MNTQKWKIRLTCFTAILTAQPKTADCRTGAIITPSTSKSTPATWPKSLSNNLPVVSNE
jgi:hypothetical protein